MLNRYPHHMMHHAAQVIERIGIIIMKILLRGVFLFLVVNTIIFFYYERYMVAEITNLEGNADAVIILGASVKGNKLSQIVQDRTETAIQVYQQGKAEKILISGDGDDENYNEVATINRYLINRSIPPADIFVDFAGYDTYDSMWRAEKIYGVQSVIISTQRFHLPRALLIARTLGMDAEGIIADRTVYSNAERNSLRESFARIKAIINLTLKSDPAVSTGDSIDIHGRGNTSTNF